MNCPACGSQCGVKHEMHWEGTQTAMTEQHVCKCSWRGPAVPLTAEERAAIDAEVDAWSTIGTRGLHLKDLPTAARRKALQALAKAEK